MFISLATNQATKEELVLKHKTRLTDSPVTLWNLTNLSTDAEPATKSSFVSSNVCAGAMSSVSLNPMLCRLMYSFTVDGAESSWIDWWGWNQTQKGIGWGCVIVGDAAQGKYSPHPVVKISIRTIENRGLMVVCDKNAADAPGRRQGRPNWLVGHRESDVVQRRPCSWNANNGENNLQQCKASASRNINCLAFGMQQKSSEQLVSLPVCQISSQSATHRPQERRSLSSAASRSP